MAATSIRSSQMELWTANELSRRGWTILHHNIRVAHVQIDLLARDPGGVLTLVEVKSHSRIAHLSSRQKRRLQRAAMVLAGFEPVQLVFALVRARDILLLPVDGLTQ